MKESSFRTRQICGSTYGSANSSSVGPLPARANETAVPV